MKFDSLKAERDKIQYILRIKNYNEYVQYHTHMKTRYEAS
jgi:hypothetical protein